ncbi:MAG: hypothetical protein ABEJ56_04105 [Candidatus Nanohaloarchaea archaeon]
MLVGASFLPFLLTSEHYSGLDLDLIEFLKDARLADYLTFYFKGINSIGKKAVWPAYLALVIGGSLNIGGAGSFQALGAAITSIFIGKIVDNQNRSRVIIGSVIIASGTYILMSFVTVPVTAFIVSLLNGLSYTAASVPIYSSALDHAEQEDLIEYFAVREFALGLGRVSILLLALGFFTLLEGEMKFLASFSSIALSVLAAGYFGSQMQK